MHQSKLKTLCFVFLAFATITSASATELVSVTEYRDQKGALHFYKTKGFSEDGFSGPSLLCYQGRVDHVCQLLERAADQLREAYRQGAHGYFDLLKCQTTHRSVSFSYTRHNDYDHTPDGENVAYQVNACHGE